MATTLNISEAMWKKCCPNVVEDFDRCAGITVCSVKPVMPDEWDTIYLDNGLPRVDSALAEADFVGKACLPTINGLYEWISATRRQWSRGFMGNRKRMDGTLEYEPFVKMARKGPINNQWWEVAFIGFTAGGTEPVGTWKYSVTSLSDSIPLNPAWFHINMQVFLSSKKDTGGLNQVSAIVKDAQMVGNVLTIWLAPQTDDGQTLPGVAAGSGGVATTYDHAILTRGLVNVTEYEAYCAQIPALNTNNEAYFWVGSTRYTVCDSEVQNEYIQRVLRDNAYYRQYRHVPEIEYTRQVTMDFQRRQVESFFFGQPISEFQNKDQWDQLPTITLDFGPFGSSMPDQGACVGRRANPVGVMPQLSECNRIWDASGGALNLMSLFEEIYYMQRVRKEAGVDSMVFEVCMNSTYALLFQRAMVKYYQAEMGGAISFNIDLGAQKQGPFGFYYRDYVLNFPAGAILRVVTHPYFDDWADAHARVTSVDIKTSGNMLWMLDWSTIYQAVLSSSSVTNTTGSIEDLAKLSDDLACRMKTKRTTYKHTGVTTTTVVECPESSLVINNLGYVEPTITGLPTKVGIGRVPWKEETCPPVVP